MTKREICDGHRTIAYYSGLGGLEVRHISYGIRSEEHTSELQSH